MGAPKFDYARVSPPHSFIHTSDFPSARHLADYLNYLTLNTTAYNEYFAWKQDYTFIDSRFWCRLCALVNRPR
jgi:glycoprotein 3-alpha-L-fucosyltransferase